ncbi:MAG: hypothetical protein R3A10_20400 [Caldilineaceae bacterium]
MNPPGYVTTPRQRGLGGRRRRARFSGRDGVAPGVHAGAGRRDVIRSPWPPPGVNPPGYVTTPRQRGLGGRRDEPGSAGVVW